MPLRSVLMDFNSSPDWHLAKSYIFLGSPLRSKWDFSCKVIIAILGVNYQLWHFILKVLLTSKQIRALLR